MTTVFSAIASLARQPFLVAAQTVSPEVMDDKTAATFVATVFAPVAAALLIGAIASVGLYDRALRNGGKRRTTLPFFLLLFVISVLALLAVVLVAPWTAYDLLPGEAQAVVRTLTALLFWGSVPLLLLYTLVYAPSEAGAALCGFRCVCGEACPCGGPCPSGQKPAGWWRRAFKWLPWVSPTPPPYMRVPFDGTAWGSYDPACGRSCRCGRPCPCSAPCPCKPLPTELQREYHRQIRESLHYRDHGSHNHSHLVHPRLLPKDRSRERSPKGLPGY